MTTATTTAAAAEGPIASPLTAIHADSRRSPSPPRLIVASAGSMGRLSCDLDPASEAPVQLILWFKSSNGTGPPIASLDLRGRSIGSIQATTGAALAGGLFVQEAWRDRLTLDPGSSRPASVLRIARLAPLDSGDYSCRVSVCLCILSFSCKCVT